MKFKLAVAVAVASTSALFVTAVHAQDFKPGFYAGAQLGYSPVHDLSGRPASEVTSQLGGNAHISQSKGMFSGRVFAGYKVIENIDLELGYFQSSSYSQSFSGGSGIDAYSGSASQRDSGIDYSVLLRPSISSGFNGAFVRLGGHYSRIKQHMDLNIVDVTRTVSDSSSGSGVMAGVGYDFNVAKNIDIRSEYNYMESIDGKSGGPTSTFRIGVVGKF